MSHDITIKRAVLHVLDNESGMSVLSNSELEVNSELADYLGKHIDRVIDDPNVKKARFVGEENAVLILCKLLNDNEDDFLAITTDMTNKLFNLMKQHVDIPSADLVCSVFEIDGKRYLGILKLNYKVGFTHWVHNESGGSVNSIIKHKTLLPQEGQKLEECAIISLEDYSIKVMEKQYEINGEKDFYLTKHFLKCTCDLSDNAKLKIIDRVTKEINKKYFDEDYEKAIKLKKAVSESFEETASIQLDHIAGRMFENNLGIREEYIEEVTKAGIHEKEISVPDKLIEKKFKKHKIKTDNGIEIDFPLEYAGNSDKIEFINNPDGTISIVIKNVGKIINK